MKFNKARKELNRELKRVARGESPSQALRCLHQMVRMTLVECNDNAEIMKWTIEMMSTCAEWQAIIVSPKEIAKALIQSAEEIQRYYAVDTEAEEHDNE